MAFLLNIVCDGNKMSCRYWKTILWLTFLCRRGSRLQRPISWWSQLSKLNYNVRRSFQAEMLQPNSKPKRFLDKFREWGSAHHIINSHSGQPCESGQKITLWLWCSVWSSLQGNQGLICPRRLIFQIQLCTQWTRIFTHFHIMCRFYNFRLMRIRLRQMCLGKPSVGESKTILISWPFFFQWQCKYPP